MHASQSVKIGWHWKWKSGEKAERARDRGRNASEIEQAAHSSWKSTYKNKYSMLSHHNFRLSLSIACSSWAFSIRLTSKSHFVSSHWIKHSHISCKIRAHESDNYDHDGNGCGGDGNGDDDDDATDEKKKDAKNRFIYLSLCELQIIRQPRSRCILFENSIFVNNEFTLFTWMSECETHVDIVNRCHCFSNSVSWRCMEHTIQCDHHFPQAANVENGRT